MRFYKINIKKNGNKISYCNWILREVLYLEIIIKK